MDASQSVTDANPHLLALREERGALAVRAATIPGPRRPLTRNKRGSFNVADVDTQRAHPARIDDYLVGGRHNYFVDRDLALQIQAVVPQARATVLAHRAFAAESVRRLAQSGVRQVLDIGAGLDPQTVDAVRRSDSFARVVLVDNDPVTVVNLQARWERDEELLRAVAIYGELCWPEETFLCDPRLLDVLDLTAPVAVVLGAVLQYVLDHRAALQAVARIMDAVPSGSYLVITHATADMAPRAATEWAQCYLGAATPLVLRSGEQLAAFYDGLEVEDPGLVRLQAPAGNAACQIWMYGTAGRKP
jgi:hypothetical protein